MKNRLKWLWRLLVDALLTPLTLLIPRNRRKIIFGAWHGRLYSCNPKYLFEYMVRRGGFKCVWIGNEYLRSSIEMLPGAIFVRKGSFKAFWHCITAGFYAYNVQWKEDIAWIPRCRRVILLYLTHGYPDKKMGGFQFGGDGPVAGAVIRTGVFRCLAVGFLKWLGDFQYGQKAWFSASSPQGAKLRVENLVGQLSYDRMLKAGIPRADFAIRNADNISLKRELKAKYAAILGVPSDKRWYLFVPTWRHEDKYLFSFAQSNYLVDYRKILEEQDAILIEKQHNITLEKLRIPPGFDGGVSIVSNEQALQIDMQELQLASDRLITDYSGVYYDSVLMNRPVLHFVYDFDHFMNKDMGFCFDIRDYGGGPFAYTEEELINILRMTDNDILKLRSPRTISEQLCWEKGNSCEAYYELIDRLSRERGYLVP